jgi:hypothetical protein
VQGARGCLVQLDPDLPRRRHGTSAYPERSRSCAPAASCKQSGHRHRSKCSRRTASRSGWIAIVAHQQLASRAPQPNSRPHDSQISGFILESTISAWVDGASRTCVVSNRTSLGTALYVRLKEEPMTPNRIVALITPACALAAGWAASWLADNVPGLNIPADNLQAVFIAGAVAVILPALQWLHGWQKWEERNDAQITAAQQGFPDATPIAMPVDAVEDEPEAADLDDDYEDLVDFDDLEDTSVEEEEPVPAG